MNNAPPAVTPEPAAAVRAAWEAYKSAINLYFNTLRGINTVFGEVFPNHYAVEIASRYKHADLLVNTARNLQKTLIAKAEQQFGSPAVPLVIDESAINEAFPIERPPYSSDDEDVEILVPFNPEGVWAWLEARYGGERGKNESLRQAAARLCKIFYLDHKPPRFQSGYLVLDLSVHVDSFDKKNSGVNRLSYHAEEDLLRAFGALEDFANATNRRMLCFGVQSLRQDIGRRHIIRSRQKFAVGDKGTELLLVTYLDRFEFRLRADTAEDLQMFLGAHLATAAA